MWKNSIKKNAYVKVVSIAVLVMLTFVIWGCSKNINSDNLSVPNDQDNTIIKVNATLEGGSGKARIEEAFICNNDGKLTARLKWSSSNYDYMIVDNTKYYPVNTEGNSVFEIPILSDKEVDVIADTTAMGTPHEIEYKIIFSEYSEDDVDDNKTVLNNKNNTGSDAAHKNVASIEKWTENHTVTGKIEREYAANFSIVEYDSKYYLLKINDVDYYLLLDEGVSKPDDLPGGIDVILLPVNNIYVVSTSAVDYFSSLDSVKNIKYLSMNKNDITDENIVDAIDKGEILYAGKYSAPDYEMLLFNGCNLIIENTMIYHKPEILDKLRKLGFTVIVEESNQEETPAGRMEWIKLIGFLTGKYETAVEIFNAKKNEIEKGYENTEKRVAYFYISSAGAVVTRKNDDYIPALIETAGGVYALSDKSEYDGDGTMNVQAESFYKDVQNADYFIYNSSITGEINNIEDLIVKCPVLKNTKAVKNGNVYCNTGDFYKSVMSFPEIVDDINKMINGVNELKYLNKLSD